jgi:hypothetical protein
MLPLRFHRRPRLPRRLSGGESIIRPPRSMLTTDSPLWGQWQSAKRAKRASAGMVYGDRPCAESAAIRNAAAMKERLCFGMTAFLLNRWIFAVSVSLSRATLM